MLMGKRCLNLGKVTQKLLFLTLIFQLIVERESLKTNILSDLFKME